MINEDWRKPKKYWRTDNYSYKTIYTGRESNPCAEIKLSETEECRLGGSSMRVGDYVVYLKYGDYKQLGRNKKNIWQVCNIDPNIQQATLKSITDETSRFQTNMGNLVSIAKLDNDGKFRRNYFNAEAFNMYTGTSTNARADSANETFKQEYKGTFVENEKMMNRNNMVKRTMDSNVDAAKVAAKITTGRTVNAVAMDKIKGQLPMMVKGYADTPMGMVVLANLVDAGVKQFAPDNRKFAYVSDAMMQAAMVDFLDAFDFESMFTEILSGVTLGDIAES